MKILIIVAFHLIATNLIAQNTLINTKWNAHFEIPRSFDTKIEFKKDTFSVYRPNGMMAESNYFIQSNDSLFIRKLSGVSPCQDASVGWYKIEWLENGSKFILHNLSDSCRPRSNAWTSMRIVAKLYKE